MRLRRQLTWLWPGMRVKRWVAVILLGVLLFAAGLSTVLDISLLAALEHLSGFVYIVTGHLFTPVVWAVIICVLGLALIAWGLRQMVRSITQVLRPAARGRLAETIYRHRRLPGGPRIVALGGGTGLSALLRGLKHCTQNLAAVVTVADDGGSSGRLRREMGILPPGDIRNCIVALADSESLMTDLFQHRFQSETDKALGGHSFGNLLIAAMTEITGDFEAAVKETSRVLAIRGRVLPSTLEDVTLRAELADGRVLEGESNIAQSPAPIVRVSLQPQEPEPLDEVIAAILEADIVVVGPGSLYTSILPDLLIKGMVEAMVRSPAPKVYVCNVMTQPGETRGYTASDHLRAIVEHIGVNPFDYVIVNTGRPTEFVLAAYRAEGADVVQPDLDEIRRLGSRPVAADLLSRANLARHDPTKLARTLLRLLAVSARGAAGVGA